MKLYNHGYLGRDKDDDISPGKCEVASSPAGHPHPVQIQPELVQIGYCVLVASVLDSKIIITNPDVDTFVENHEFQIRIQILEPKILKEGSRFGSYLGRKDGGKFKRNKNLSMFGQKRVYYVHISFF